jgi:DNA-binding response OmpR family regulator
VYILVVDDNRFENTLVHFVLTKEGYEVETIDNPKGALHMIERREPDLLLLDVTMPDQDGFQFSEQLRSEGYDMPFIFMTAMDGLEDKLRGFRNGADDYICKPYNLQELVARVHAVMRRMKKNSLPGNQSIRAGQCELFPADLKFTRPDRPPVDLTHTEMQVLRVLMRSANQVVERAQLLNEVWHDDGNNSNNVDVYIGRLRRKIEDDYEHPLFIQSVRGIGYKFVSK